MPFGNNALLTLMLLVPMFSSEQSKDTVLYYQRNYRQENGMCTGMPLPIFFVVSFMHNSSSPAKTLFVITVSDLLVHH